MRKSGWQAALLAAIVWIVALLPVAAQSQPAVFGHRGGRKWAPENTLASFGRCVEKGYGIELDIHKCKSGELIVCHDENVARTTDGSGMIKDMTLQELRALSAGKWFGPRFAGEKLPLLSEVLALVDGKVPIMIEIKNAPVKYPGIDDDLLKMLDGYKAKDKIIIISFDHQILHRIHEKAPDYKIGFLDAGIPYDIGVYAKGVGAAAWHPDFEGIRSDNVAEAHKAGVLVNAWTMNKESEWKSGANMGLDGIVTDDPEGCSDYLKAHAPATAAK
ncbi:MAG TPA: glycerophosphodiester phosphodiesterase family protein [Planktothrix sp.]